MSAPFPYLEASQVTDPGLKRKNNEDSLLLLPQAGLFCVADGMGGTRGGEVASKATVDALAQTFNAAPEAAYAVTALAAARLAARAINQASNWIKERAEEMGLSGTGSTIVTLVFDRVTPTRALLLHAGDSRAYRFRGNKLEQLTTDHSVAAEAGVDDEEKLPAMFRGVITRAVGLERTVKLDETDVTVAPGDLYLICSDGLTKMTSDKNITRILRKSEGADLQQRAQKLIDAAIEAGGHDNVTVILVQVAKELPSAPTMEVSAETRTLESMSLPQSTTAVTEDDEALTSQTADTAGLAKIGVTPNPGESGLTPPSPISAEGITPTDPRDPQTIIAPAKQQGHSRHRTIFWILLILLLASAIAVALCLYMQCPT